MFPGQGSQKTGMGAGLFEEFPEETTAANDILGYRTSAMCLEAEYSEKISETLYTQPLLYVVNALSYLKHKRESALPSDVFIGHSLGEYNALLAAGLFSFTEGLKLVQERARLMHELGKTKPGAMAAVIGLSDEEVLAVLKNEETVQVANYNSRGQVIISGEKERIHALAAAFQAKKARRYLLLRVSGAFHSKYMQEASTRLRSYLDGFIFKTLEKPVYANVSAAPYPIGDTSEMKNILALQIMSPVRWHETVLAIKKMALTKAAKTVEFTECGPGRVLTGLVKNM